MFKLEENLFFLLKHKILKYFFIGKFLSDIAKWVQITTIPWLVYSLTGSSMKLGIVSFLEYIMLLFIPPLSGIIIKQFSRKKIIIIINFLLLILFIGIFTLYYFNLLKMLYIYLFAIITGFLMSFDLTTKQILISDILQKEKIINAIGFNSLLSNIARFIAPSVAGFFIYLFNEGFCFFINIIFILFAICLYSKMNIQVTKTKDNYLKCFKKYRINLYQTILFLKKSFNIKYMLLLIAIISFSMNALVVLMPIFAKDIYNLSATGFGILLSARGLGALFATFILISKNKYDNLIKSALNLSFCILILIILFALLNNIYCAFILFAIMGCLMVVNTGYINSFIQIFTPCKIRPVVMGFFISFFLGFVPIGNLITGFLCTVYSAQIVCCGIGIFSLILYFFLKIKLNNENKLKK